MFLTQSLNQHITQTNRKLERDRAFTKIRSPTLVGFNNMVGDKNKKHMKVALHAIQFSYGSVQSSIDQFSYTLKLRHAVLMLTLVACYMKLKIV